jgi:DNA-binding IscR family transcriptional regulator
VEPDYHIADCLSVDSQKDICSYSDCCKIRDPLAEVQKKIDKVFFETKLAHII